MTNREAAEKLARVVEAYLTRWEPGGPLPRYRALRRALEDFKRTQEVPLDLATILDEMPDDLECEPGQIRCVECGKPFYPRHSGHVFCQTRCRNRANNRRHNPLRDRRSPDNRT